jgi:hypothetical protein
MPYDASERQPALNGQAGALALTLNVDQNSYCLYNCNLRRPIMTEAKKYSEDQTEHKAKEPKKSAYNKPLLAALIILIIILAFAVVAHSKSVDKKNKASGTTSTNANSANNSSSGGSSSGSSSSAVKNGNLSLTPSSQQVKKGSDLTLEIWADSHGQQVNAVQVNLAYPADKLNFVKVDESGSAFSISANSTGGNGKVTISRGNIKPVSGRVLVAKVQFTALDDSGNASVTFDKGTSLISSVTNKDILNTANGGNFTLSQ